MRPFFAPVLVILHASVALALPAPPPSPDATSVFPGNNTDLPSNGRAVFFAIDGNDNDVEIVRVDDAEEFPVQHESVRVGAVNRALIVSPPLAPNTLISFATRCGSCTFTVDYQVRADADEAPPVWRDGEAEVTLSLIRNFLGQHVGYDVVLSLPHAEDDSAGGVWTVARRAGNEEAIIEASAVHASDARRVELAMIAGLTEERLCFDVTAVDVAGNEARFPEQVCTDLAPELAENGGCAQSGSARVSIIALLAVLSFARRRNG